MPLTDIEMSLSAREGEIRDTVRKFAAPFAAQTAFETASAAVQIFGGNGLSREYPVEKLMRDARASMIEDGCNEALGLVAAAKL